MSLCHSQGKPKDAANAVKSSVDYTLNGVGLRTGQTRNSTVGDAFGYDANRQVTGATVNQSPGVTLPTPSPFTYNYDPAGNRTTFYMHVVARVVNRAHIFDDLAKQQFLSLMRRYEAFDRLRICGFCLMDNHYHILLEVARQGLETVVKSYAALMGGGLGDWNRIQDRYRVLMYLRGLRVVKEGGRVEGVFDANKVEEVWEAKGEISGISYAATRLRYFTDGLVIGSKEYVGELFRQNKDRFGKTRKTGARKMQGADWGRLRSLRDLRKDPLANTAEPTEI